MKKILVYCLLAFSFFIIPAKATEEAPTDVSFIYINGSNNMTYRNREKFKTAFLRDVQKLHPEIKKRFEKDELINKNFLKDGKFTINPTPITFYWGDKSIKIIENIDKDLDSAKKYSPKISHQVRSIFAHCLHDAVWVQKYHNMTKVLDELHQVVQGEIQKGRKVVLLGYSAGSFVTYQYYMNKSISIYPQEFTLNNYPKEIEKYIANTPIQPTCFDALVEANIFKFNPETGNYLPLEDVEVFKKNYLNIDKITPNVCFANDSVKGVIGFASPARLFYSDLMNPGGNLSNLSLLMSRTLVENDAFYLTVNYQNDPFGFSNAENFTYKKLEEIYPNKNAFAKNGKGFIYNKSDNYVPRTFITAHLAYWQTPKRFAKAIVKAFNEGYRNFYNLNNN